MQHYYYRLFRWENGAKSQELTQYLTLPIFIEDRLDETLDTAQVTLKGVPTSTMKEAFAPKTKFRLERYMTKNFSDVPRYWDFVCANDNVQEYVGAPNICTHRIDLIEASAIAQNMSVDNIALTYQLSDVTLNYTTIPPDTDTVGGSNALILQNENSMTATHVHQDMLSFGTRYFINTYRYIWSNLASINGLTVRNYGGESKTINFTIPTLMCQSAPSGAWIDIFECATRTTITKVHRHGSTILSQEALPIGVDGALFRLCGPSSLPAVPSAQNAVWVRAGRPFLGSTPAWYVSTAYPRRVQDFGSQSTGLIISLSNLQRFDQNFRPAGDGVYAITDARNDYQSKNISITTDALTQTQLENGEHIEYRIETIMDGGGSVIVFYQKTATVEDRGNSFANFTGNNQDIYEQVPRAQIRVAATLDFYDTSTTAEGGLFSTRGRPYNCYDLFRRALLTTDSKLIVNTTNLNDGNKGLDQLDYPIIVNPDWMARLRSYAMSETIFEMKNLWEVLLQIGYYLHAIPFLEFAKDGTDRFELKFRQLGDNILKEDRASKLTIFNSRNITEYFAEFDSYVTNLFSPQDIVDEWVVAKTTGNSSTVSNDTAEIHTKYPILELIDFRVSVGNGTPVSALNYVFEQSIYDGLTNENPNQIIPAKGNSIYYAYGTNKILGLNYVAPQASGGTFAMALQNICARVLGVNAFNTRFNDLRFHVVYRTQDNARISQFRPDLQDYLKNSSYENQPNHSQFYGQQDKIVDSERLSANLFGKLIRGGNNICERNEIAYPGLEKESGDLVEVDGQLYYVKATENEAYNATVKQKVTYSKNFNEISNVITVPSEPRFYEVSERSRVRREVRHRDFLALSTTPRTNSTSPRFLNNSTWRDFIKRLLFNNPGAPTLPNYAYTRFTVDYKRQHNRSNGLPIPHSQMFPSSEVIRTGPNSVMPVAPSDNSQCIVAVQKKPLRGSILFSWEMEDNFKAGDWRDSALSGGSGNQAYEVLQPVRYCDVMGRADLFTFKLFNRASWTHAQARQLPKAVVVPSDSESPILVPSPYQLGLDKDNREELSFNYQIVLLHKTSEDDDDFITFQNLFGEKSGALRMCFLNQTQTMFSERIDLSAASMVADNVAYTLVDAPQNSIRVDISTPPGVDLSQVQSIALYQLDAEMGRWTYIVKNVAKLPNNQKLQSWYIYPVYNI